MKLKRKINLTKRPQNDKKNTDQIKKKNLLQIKIEWSNWKQIKIL